MSSKGKIYSLWHLISMIFFFLTFMFSYAFFIVLIVLSNVENTIIISILEGVSIFFCVILCYSIFKEKYNLKLNVSKLFLKKEIYLFLKGFIINGIIYIFFIYITFYFNALNFTLTNQNPYDIIIGIMLIGIFKFYLVALSEEFIFREFAIDYLFNNNVSKIWVIMFTSICFALIHGWESFLVFFLLLISGFILSISYIIFNSISFSVGVHFSWNLLIYMFSLDNNANYGLEYPQLLTTEHLQLFGRHAFYYFDVLSQIVLCMIIWILYKTKIKNIFKGEMSVNNLSP